MADRGSTSQPSRSMRDFDVGSASSHPSSRPVSVGSVASDADLATWERELAASRQSSASLADVDRLMESPTLDLGVLDERQPPAPRFAAPPPKSRDRSRGRSRWQIPGARSRGRRGGSPTTSGRIQDLSVSRRSPRTSGRAQDPPTGHSVGRMRFAPPARKVAVADDMAVDLDDEVLMAEILGPATSE